MLPVARTALLSALVLSNCGRTEEAQSLRPPAATATDDGAPAEQAPQAGSPSSTAEPSCLVPMSAEAPPPSSPVGQCPTDPANPSPLPEGELAFADAPGQPRIVVELARTDADRARGLMYRTELGENAGMLFSWSDERVRSFWMRNTCLPLDMLFISQTGTVLGVLEQVPPMNEASRSIPCPARHVLEVNAGFTRAHGIKPGQRVLLPNE